MNILPYSETYTIEEETNPMNKKQTPSRQNKATNMNRNQTPSQEFIDYICNLYGDIYDDRIEDSRPPAAGNHLRDPGTDWTPGQTANHKSLAAFQKQLESNGIKLSTSKIKKILITGGCWTTDRSRKISDLLAAYTTPASEGGKGLSPDAAVKEIARHLNVSIVTVSVNLPYKNVVYNLENRSSNAVRCSRYKERKRKSGLKHSGSGGSG